MTGNDWTGDPHDAAAGPSEPALPEPAGFGPAPDPAFGGVIGSDIIEMGPASPGRSSRRTRVLAASAAVLVVLAAGGVLVATQGSSQASPAAILTAAAHKSASFSSVTAAFTEQVGGGLGSSVRGTAVEIRKPLQLSMQLSESGDGQPFSLSGIIVSDTMYLKFGAMSGLPKSVVGKWIEFPLSGLAGGAFSTMLAGVENENPTSQLQMLLASKNVHADGTQVIDGVQTSKYGGYFTEAAALKMLPASIRSEFGSLLKEVRGDIHFTIWIDGNDRIRKLVETETIDSQPVTVTYTFTNYNQPVTITAPPSDQVMKIPASALAG